MNVLRRLEKRAIFDGDLLTRNQRLGDRLEVPRLVDFELVANARDDASRVHDWIAERGYGETILYTEGGEHRVILRILIPTTPHILRCVSGLMIAIASELGVQYNGWACPLQPP